MSIFPPVIFTRIEPNRQSGGRMWYGPEIVPLREWLPRRFILIEKIYRFRNCRERVNTTLIHISLLRSHGTERTTRERTHSRFPRYGHFPTHRYTPPPRPQGQQFFFHLPVEQSWEALLLLRARSFLSSRSNCSLSLRSVCSRRSLANWRDDNARWSWATLSTWTCFLRHSSSSRTTLDCALVNAVSSISMCVRCSSSVARWAANSISCRSLAANKSLSGNE